MESVKKTMLRDFLQRCEIKFEADLIDTPSMNDIVLQWKIFIREFDENDEDAPEYKLLSNEIMESGTINQLTKDGFRIYCYNTTNKVSAIMDLTHFVKIFNKYKCKQLIKDHVSTSTIVVKREGSQIWTGLVISTFISTLSDKLCECDFYDFYDFIKEIDIYGFNVVQCFYEDLINMGFEDVKLKYGKITLLARPVTLDWC